MTQDFWAHLASVPCQGLVTLLPLLPQCPLPRGFPPSPQLLCTLLGRKVPKHPLSYICLQSTVPAVASKDVLDIAFPVASLVILPPGYLGLTLWLPQVHCSPAELPSCSVTPWLPLALAWLSLTRDPLPPTSKHWSSTLFVFIIIRQPYSQEPQCWCEFPCPRTICSHPQAAWSQRPSLNPISFEEAPRQHADPPRLILAGTSSRSLLGLQVL